MGIELEGAYQMFLSEMKYVLCILIAPGMEQTAVTTANKVLNNKGKKLDWKCGLQNLGCSCGFL